MLDPAEPLPSRPSNWRSRWYSARRHAQSQPPPSSSSPPSPRNTQSQRPRNRVPPRQRRQQAERNSEQQYDPDKVGRCMWDSLKVFGLGLGASETEVKVKFRAMSRVYHPDKHNPDQAGMSNSQATAFFQLLNNAYSYLREVL